MPVLNMIITVSNDQSILSIGSAFQRLYPTESLLRFDDFIANPTTYGFEINNSLPTRITFAAHAGNSDYGEKDATTFANELIASLKKIAKTNPKIKSSLTHIDLVGCSNGNVDEHGQGYTVLVAKKLLELKKDGFQELRVSAFTNRLLDDDNKFFELRTYVNTRTNEIVHCGYKTEKDLEESEIIFSQLDILYEQLSQNDDELYQLYNAKEKLEEVSTGKTEENNKEFALINELIEESNKKNINIITNLEQLLPKRYEKAVRIIETNDVRKTFDLPQCDFTALAKENINKKIAKLDKKILDIKNQITQLKVEYDKNKEDKSSLKLKETTQTEELNTLRAKEATLKNDRSSQKTALENEINQLIININQLPPSKLVTTCVKYLTETQTNQQLSLEEKLENIQDIMTQAYKKSNNMPEIKTIVQGYHGNCKNIIVKAQQIQTNLSDVNEKSINVGKKLEATSAEIKQCEDRNTYLKQQRDELNVNKNKLKEKHDKLTSLLESPQKTESKEIQHQQDIRKKLHHMQEDSLKRETPTIERPESPNINSPRSNSM